jgi:uncharacterized membrane protein
MSALRIEKTMSIVLATGIVIALIIVLAGGSLYLYEHGAENMQLEFTRYTNASIPLNHLFNASPQATLNVVNIGLFILVGTQLLRVLLLFFYYFWQRDYIYTVISLFVTMVLIYSTLYPFLP